MDKSYPVSKSTCVVSWEWLLCTKTTQISEKSWCKLGTGCNPCGCKWTDINCGIELFLPSSPICIEIVFIRDQIVRRRNLKLGLKTDLRKLVLKDMCMCLNQLLKWKEHLQNIFIEGFDWLIRFVIPDQIEQRCQ